jgi:hypothetical protein
MQPVRILTPSFQLLGEIDDYESLQFTRRASKPGEFELHINLNKNNSDTLQEDNLVMLSPKKVGVIRHREISRSDAEQLVIKGYTLQGILSRRITEPPSGKANDSIKASVETAMKHYVNNNAVNPTDSTRVIPNLIIAEDKGQGQTVSWDSRYKQLDEELTSLSTDAIGWDVYLDLENQKFVFDVIVGRNLSVNQTDNPPVIFSIDFDNIKSQTFIDSANSYKNTAYVGGQGEGENRAIAEVGDNLTGLARIETFIDARDLEDDTLLPARGMDKLKELQKVLSFESEILTYGPFIYEQDWDLGDLVTVQDKKLGLTIDTPIPEVKEIYESGGFRLEATFGNTVPTIIDKIKQAIDGPMTEKAFIPSKTSELENDAGYVTQDDVNTIAQDKSYTHEQLSPAAQWIIIHNLDKYPSVTIVDSSGKIVFGDVKHESINKVTLSFTAAFSGKAFLN